MLSFARTADPELVYRQPMLARMVGPAVGIALLALLLALWPSLLALALPVPAMLVVGALWLAGIAACLWAALSLRVAFIFGVDGVTARGAWRTRTLAYEHIAGCTVVHEERAKGRGAVVRGYRLTFEAMRSGIPPLHLFVQEGLPLDAAIVRRLKTVPGLSRRQLIELERAQSRHVESA